MINHERLIATFQKLVAIDSVSREEAAICHMLKTLLTQMGAEVVIDDAGRRTGANTGNLIARFKGNAPVAPVMLNAHMDTVEPGRGVTAVLTGGRFTSKGDTILGADDKSAIAILLETLMVIQENRLPCGPIELVLTICEEVGLLGARHLDVSLLNAKFGYTLDTQDTGAIITRAPSANKLSFIIHGKDAHAGVAPEKGINAIALAAKAIAALNPGRIDAETTCNIGFIQGGFATNIVPSRVEVKGEARSHDEGKLERVTREMMAAFEAVVTDHPFGEDGPRLEYSVENEFRATHIPDDHPVVRLACRAARNLSRTLTPRTTGGGADANIFFEKGIYTGVLGTGMQDMHTVRESILLADMIGATKLMLEILRLHATQG